MFTRRTFLSTVGAGLAVGPLALQAQPAAPERKRMAIVTTVWRYRSHAWHMAERFLVGYPHRGPLASPAAGRGLGLRRSDARGRPEPPAVRGVRLPDLSHDRRGPALRRRQAGRRCRADHRRARQLPEQRDRPDASIRATSSSSRSPTSSAQDGRTVPGLQRQAPVVELGLGQGDGRDLARAEASRSWPARRCRSPGGCRRSTCPTGPRSRRCCASRSAASTATTSTPWKTIQCMAERRRGGETGVAAMQALRGDAVWKAMDAGVVGRPAAGTRGCSRPACRRSQTLAQPDDVQPPLSRPPAQIREWVKDPIAYRFEYADGLKATMLLMNGLVGDFTFAARLEGPGRAALDAVLPAAEPERRLLGGPDVEGRGDVPDRQGALPDRAHAADHRPGRGRRAVARRRARSGSRRRTWPSATRRRASRRSGRAKVFSFCSSDSTSLTCCSSRWTSPGSSICLRAPESCCRSLARRWLSTSIFFLSRLSIDGVSSG